MRTKDPLVCECGHKGYLHCLENDQPFSSLWESYRLEGFDGEKIVITSFADAPKDLLAAMKPTCPKCGQTNKVKYAPRS